MALFPGRIAIRPSDEEPVEPSGDLRLDTLRRQAVERLGKPVADVPEQESLGRFQSALLAFAGNFGGPFQQQRLQLELARRSPEFRSQLEIQREELQTTRDQQFLRLLEDEQKRKFIEKIDIRRVEVAEGTLDLNQQRIDIETEQLKQKIEQLGKDQEGRDVLFEAIFSNVEDLGVTVGAVRQLLGESTDPIDSIKAQQLLDEYRDYEDFVEGLEKKGDISEIDIKRAAILLEELQADIANATQPANTIRPSSRAIEKLDEQRAGLDGVTKVLDFLNKHPEIGLTPRVIASKIVGKNIAFRGEFGALLSQFEALLDVENAPIRTALVGVAQNERELEKVESFLVSIGMTRTRMLNGLRATKAKLEGARRSTIKTLDLNGFDVRRERQEDVNANNLNTELGINRFFSPSPQHIAGGIPANAVFNPELSTVNRTIFMTPDGRVFGVFDEDVDEDTGFVGPRQLEQPKLPTLINR